MTVKNALIVGAGPGLSSCVARKLAARGAKVALAARSLETNQEFAEAIGGRAYRCGASKVHHNVIFQNANVPAWLDEPTTTGLSSAACRREALRVDGVDVELELKLRGYLADLHHLAYANTKWGRPTHRGRRPSCCR